MTTLPATIFNDLRTVLNLKIGVQNSSKYESRVHIIVIRTYFVSPCGIPKNFMLLPSAQLRLRSFRNFSSKI